MNDTAMAAPARAPESPLATPGEGGTTRANRAAPAARPAAVPDPAAGVSAAPAIEALNRGCFCIGIDDAALANALEAELGQPGLAALVRERCPHLFASRPVFVSHADVQRIGAVVRAVESVVALPGYREAVLARAPAIARHPTPARSVFFGYDFHAERGRLGLIEINTNAGGAMLNAVLARAQRACCTAVEPWLPPAGALERSIVAMFRNEWRLARPGRALRRIAIVDTAPAQQYLFPDFVLFQRLFERTGIAALIADPAELVFERGALRHRGDAVDLVYNRLTDFALETAPSAALREAYLADAVVLTPHPQAHALYADKRNLALLSSDAALREFGVGPAERALLIEHVPRTRVVHAADAERLWNERRGLFFKPAAGFGSRAAYRGDKLTRRVWQEIAAGGYVAQDTVAPGERVIDAAPQAQVLKYDLRAYVYDGALQWLAARLYQGQTTNFRTPGGGFAPVYAAPPTGDDDAGAPALEAPAR